MAIHIREIAVSATPTEQWTKFKYARCPLWIDETQGQWLARFNGMVLPTLSGVEPTPPTVLALEDEFPSLRPYLAKSEDRKKYNLCNDPKFAKELLSVLSGLVSKNKNCVFLRPDSRKKNCRKLTEILSGMDQHIKFDMLTYFGALDKALFGDSTKNQMKTVKEVLLDGYRNKDAYAILVTGSGRSKYGDSFPNIMSYHFDFYNSPFNWESLRQATIGRSCGFFKDSFVYMRKNLVREWNYYYANGCKDDRVDGRDPSNRSRHYLNKRRRGRASLTARINFQDWSSFNA